MTSAAKVWRCPYEESNFGRRSLSRFLAKDVYVASIQTCLFFEFAKLGRFDLAKFEREIFEWVGG